MSLLCFRELFTKLVMINLHGAVPKCAKDGDDGHFPDCHFTHVLQVFIPLLNIHAVLLCWRGDQLK